MLQFRLQAKSFYDGTDYLRRGFTNSKDDFTELNIIEGV